MGEIAEGQRLIREILTTQRQLLIDLRPTIKHARFNRDTLDAFAREWGLGPLEWGEHGPSGHLLGIPFTVSPLVPAGEVWVTTDFERWQILRTGE